MTPSPLTAEQVIQPEVDTCGHIGKEAADAIRWAYSDYALHVAVKLMERDRELSKLP